MKSHLEIKASAQNQTTKSTKEKILSPRACRSLKVREKGNVSKTERPFERSHIDQHPEIMQNVIDGQKQQSRKKATEAEELVKYMSDLPCYLQRAGKGINVQEKALNFGVLDWGRLERWKCEQKRVSGGRNVLLPSRTNTLSTHTFGQNQQGRSDCETSSSAERKKAPTLDFYLNLSAKGSVKGHSHALDERPSERDVSLHDSGTSPKRDRSIDRQHPRSEHKKSNTKDLDSKVAMEKAHHTSETASSYSKEHEALAFGKGKTKTWGGECRRVEQSLDSGLHLPDESCVNDHFTYDFLSVRKHPEERSPESLSEDFHFRLSLSSAVPHSCPFPCNSQRSEWSDIKNSGPVDVQDGETLYSYSGETAFICSKSKHEEQSESITTSKEQSAVKPPNGLGPVIAEATTRTPGVPSCDLQPVTSLNKIARSSSFREVSASQQVNSTFAAATISDSSNKDKSGATTRGKSSPLRRILDPLLKSKVSHRLSFDKTDTVSSESGGTIKHSSCEVLKSMHRSKSAKARPNCPTDQPMKRHLSFSTLSSADTQEKHMGLKMHALLQLSCKNGLPLFTFTFNDSDILAAMLRKVYVSGKDDFEWVYTFYSVHEIKMKGRGWINQGSKNKQHGFASNVVGQMNVSCSQCHHPLGDDPSSHSMVREFVLFGAELQQAPHETLDFLPNRELAAIVVKVPKENGNFDGNELQSDISRTEPASRLADENGLCCQAEYPSHSSIMVILPGGDHGQPVTAGAPSSLLDRWRSGGLCDCGGWDVGCRLTVLASVNQDRNSLSSSQACNISNGTDHQVDLVIQGGAQENWRLLSLASFKEGLYTVDFNAPLSLLQAFSICIAVLHGRMTANLSGVHSFLHVKSSSDPMSTENGTIKSSTKTQGEIPASYFPYPPHSPVGRV